MPLTSEDEKRPCWLMASQWLPNGPSPPELRGRETGTGAVSVAAGRALVWLTFGNDTGQSPLCPARDPYLLRSGVEFARESHSCCKEVTFQPPFVGFKTCGTSSQEGPNADNRSRRRRPQYPDFRVNGAGSGRLSH